MRVKDASKKLNQYVKLMELHEEDKMKVVRFSSFIAEIENSGMGLKALLTKAQNGNYKLSEDKQTLLWDLLETGTFAQFDELLSQTPSGVLEMMKLPGLGSKKIRTLWKDLGVTDLLQLKEACLENKVSELKGFGKKTESNVLEAVDYVMENKSKLLFPHAQFFAESVIKELKDYIADLDVQVVGDLKRNLNVITSLQLAINKEDKSAVFGVLNDHDLFDKDLQKSSPFKWVGYLIDVDCPIEIILLSEPKGNQLIKLNSAEGYLASFENIIKVNSEEEFYEAQGKQFIPADMRELENTQLLNSSNFDVNKVVQANNIKGCLHNHSLYSDGQNTIAEMAAACKQLGLSYFGISDHIMIKKF